jgi:hypothetical protein
MYSNSGTKDTDYRAAQIVTAKMQRFHYESTLVYIYKNVTASLSASGPKS